MASGSSEGARPEQDTYTSLTLVRTQQVTVVLPVIGLLAVLIAVLAMSQVMPREFSVAIIFAVASLAIIVFSRTVFKVLDRLQGRLRRQNQQLRALYHSSLAASAHLSLKAILQIVADSARELARARYTVIFVGDGENVEHVIASGATPEEARILE